MGEITQAGVSRYLVISSAVGADWVVWLTDVLSALAMFETALFGEDKKFGGPAQWPVSQTPHLCLERPNHQHISQQSCDGDIQVGKEQISQTAFRRKA